MLRKDDLTIADGEEGNGVVEEATALIDNGRWSLCNDGKGLERSFKFKTFKTTWDFMTHVASECKKQKHHPEWTNVYNHTRIRWTTHKPEGLSRRDTSMARFCDEAGEQFEEVGGVQDLVADAKECCGGGGGGVKKA